ncbi:hypothetical protein [Clostridium botulinum]|uniref:hypothetical protein n=1 Tax=Clostridium botulinum TaxID=1491 RepID=UPI0004D94375|nr:hypothetical protein [Clostridium botulinum]KEI05445.1 hypothetical protein Z952_05220 [Clostridium botulinum C/D str. BKT75002]KEI09396.1 hypothetical protein Z954_12750 [Clostridium botulinum C/D str. BKT2873]MCD3349416.1 hypothetical protein [Clostridium botulinum D/C]MCD3358593.1 hypothetical protein [Clostridium botulinum D/C]MCD3363666.1 hypothetical protein [Clostridium botulinum D/C]
MKKSIVLKIFGIFSTLFIVFYTYSTLASDASASCYTFNACSPKQVTYNNFLKINIGSKYADIVNILGSESCKNTKVINGLKNHIYLWKVDGTEESIFITFRNGIVITKEQYKLNEKNNNFCNKKVKELNHGMTYDNVKSILGNGTLRSESKSTQVYSWCSDSSCIICTFNNDKLNIFTEK